MILIHTVSGRPIYLDNLQPGDIDLEVVARGLSHACRFAGQLDEFYSVAQHAVLVSRLVDPAFRYPALHHDDSEAVMGDMSRELKHHPNMSWYRQIEAGVQEACNKAMGIEILTPEVSKHLKVADDLAAIYERAVIREGRRFRTVDIDVAHLTGWVKRSTPYEMKELAHRLPQTWTPWDIETAYGIFKQEHVTLRAESISSTSIFFRIPNGRV